MPAKIHEARNLPAMTVGTVTGSVSRSSIVPVLRSSAQSRMETAGIRKRYSQGCHVKKLRRSACSPS